MASQGTVRLGSWFRNSACRSLFLYSFISLITVQGQRKRVLHVSVRMSAATATTTATAPAPEQWAGPSIDVYACSTYLSIIPLRAHVASHTPTTSSIPVLPVCKFRFVSRHFKLNPAGSRYPPGNDCYFLSRRPFHVLPPSR